MPLTKHSRGAGFAVLVGLVLAAISVTGSVSITELAVAVQPGIGSVGDSADTLRSYGTFFVGAGAALVLFLAVFRGREIRRQHPRSFN